MACLLDANILLRISEPGHRQHKVALDALRAVSTEYRCVLIPQTFYEYWAVASRPVEANGLGLPPDAIDERLRDFQRMFFLAKDERAVYGIWRGIVHEYGVVGPRVHDARYVAAMFRHQISHLLTFNVRDFGRYDGISVLSPAKIVKKLH